MQHIDELVEENIGLVYTTINRHFKRYANDDDVLQIGRIGLWKAAKTFDSNRLIKFSTYACACIWKEIRKYTNRAEVRWDKLAIRGLDAPAPTSLDFGTHQRRESNLDRLIDPQAETAYDHVLSKITANQLLAKIREKSPKTADILTARMDGCSLNEIAEQYGVTHQRIAQICRAAIKYLPREMRKDKP